MRHYIYRSTTDKLASDLDEIEADRGQILSVHHTGGRDWVVIFKKGQRL